MLGLVGYQIDLILVGNSGYISKSKYVKHTIVIYDESEIIDILKNNYSNEDTKTIVIACTDKVGSVLDQNYTKLKDSFFFFNCGEDGRATYFINKQVQVVGLCSWLKQYFSSRCKYYWNCKDPIPFFFAPFK